MLLGDLARVDKHNVRQSQSSDHIRAKLSWYHGTYPRKRRILRVQMVVDAILFFAGDGAVSSHDQLICKSYPVVTRLDKENRSRLYPNNQPIAIEEYRALWLAPAPLRRC